MMRGYLIVLAFSWVASSLMLTATVSRAATPQAQEQGDADAKQSSSDAEAKEKNTKKKDANEPEPDSPPPAPRGVKGLSKGIFAGPRADLDKSGKNSAFGYAMACAYERHHGRAFRDG